MIHAKTVDEMIYKYYVRVARSTNTYLRLTYENWKIPQNPKNDIK